MADAALYLGWGTVVRGREKAALGVFNESMQYYGRLQQDGKIEGFDTVILSPDGGESAGFILLRGSADQVDALRRDDEFQEWVNRAQLIVDDLRISDAYVEDGVGPQIARYEKAIAQVT